LRKGETPCPVGKKGEPWVLAGGKGHPAALARTSVLQKDPTSRNQGEATFTWPEKKRKTNLQGVLPGAGENQQKVSVLVSRGKREASSSEREEALSPG